LEAWFTEAELNRFGSEKKEEKEIQDQDQDQDHHLALRSLKKRIPAVREGVPVIDL